MIMVFKSAPPLPPLYHGGLYTPVGYSDMRLIDQDVSSS